MHFPTGQKPDPETNLQLTMRCRAESINPHLNGHIDPYRQSPGVLLRRHTARGYLEYFADALRLARDIVTRLLTQKIHACDEAFRLPLQVGANQNKRTLAVESPIGA